MTWSMVHIVLSEDEIIETFSHKVGIKIIEKTSKTWKVK